jgi:hypothetical protein
MAMSSRIFSYNQRLAFRKRLDDYFGSRTCADAAGMNNSAAGKKGSRAG